MKADVTTLGASKAGTVELAEAIFGLSRVPTSSSAWSAISCSSGAPVRTTPRTVPK